MSLRLAVTRGLLRFRPRTLATVETLHAAIAARGADAPVTEAVERVAEVSTSIVNEQTIVHLTPRRAAPSGHLIYTHGGCYTFPLIAPHWGIVAALVEQAGVSVDVPLYPLAPEHTADETYELLDRVYREAIAAHGPRVFLGGDSAGGGLVLGQALRYRDAGKVLPRALLLISPWVDVTMSNPGIADVAPRDPMLAVPGLVEAGRLWAGDLDVRDPLISPLYGDLAGLPPVHTYQGDRDILVADAKELTRRILRAGGQAELRLTRGGFHVFPGAPWTPEARRALGRMAAVLRA
jgi:monoterpene epsilon-lactone hydrolase